MRSSHLAPGIPRPALSARRVLDVFLAALALMVLSPLLILIALIIVIESGRPVLFAQMRLGQFGKPFKMYKFRKFHPKTDTVGLPLTLEKDDRLTSVGRVLLITKIDELPQLWNVLEGSMAIIGPRPETPVFAECFSGEFKQVLNHKPGILGPSQVLFRSECRLYSGSTDPEKMYRLLLFPIKAHIDLEYYRRRTLLTDLAWMVRGAVAVIRRPPALSKGADAGGARIQASGRGISANDL